MKLSVILGDITTLSVDVIVNAANERLTPGGGVCGAIHRAAGPSLAEDCAAIRHCETGRSVLTHGYRLPAPWVIHAVGPIWQGGHQDEPELLDSCYHSALELADSQGLRSIAFPCISTGIYGFPPAQACRIAVDAVRSYNPHSLESVIFCCFSAADHDLYVEALS